jgi:LAO/AO transport system kinase
MRGRLDGSQLAILSAEVSVGRPRAIARAISLAEDGDPAGVRLVGELYCRTGRARVVGVTGPPGAGKSTLVDRLAQTLRARDLTVGILCVDPTSPFSGGALLGDRIRMSAIATDPGIFIRSMATRGAMGGLARATRDAADVLDAAGFDWILIETVGVGQDEVDVVSAVDSVLVVAVPGLGDDIQAIKAGVLEIADVFVLNKADRDGADRVVRDLQMMLSLGEHGPWLPPIVRTVAMRGEGVVELLEAVERHHLHLTASGELARRRREQLRLRVETILKERVLAEVRSEGELARAVEAGFAARVDPYTVAGQLFEEVVRQARHRAAGGT